ncbi:MAG: hypothetical protein ACO1QB_03455 [Verrucomicrobiales bacterium]
MKDLAEPKWMYLKAALFLGIGLISATLLLLEQWKIETALLLGLLVWSMCRAYYFAFYVIEHYIDQTYHFSGLFSACKRLLKNKKESKVDK